MQAQCNRYTRFSVFSPRPAAVDSLIFSNHPFVTSYSRRLQAQPVTLIQVPALWQSFAVAVMMPLAETLV